MIRIRIPFTIFSYVLDPPPPPSNETTKLSNEALAQLCEMMKIYTLEGKGTRFHYSVKQ